MGTCLKLASFFMLWSVHRGVNGKAQALHKGISCRLLLLEENQSSLHSVSYKQGEDGRPFSTYFFITDTNDGVSALVNKVNFKDQLLERRRSQIDVSRENTKVVIHVPYRLTKACSWRRNSVASFLKL
ncbi:uncharacterized protein LOC107845640 [Capsicum annuum]|uniref:uncharacterized protein LOC107845640 n=1 Tax=Capsicum annuum TaxID=4072 RepID=UPI001FB0E4AB|nr:uncharacterized protein LOC107845640 [Capsicum annuum]